MNAFEKYEVEIKSGNLSAKMPFGYRAYERGKREGKYTAPAGHRVFVNSDETMLVTMTAKQAEGLSKYDVLNHAGRVLSHREYKSRGFHAPTDRDIETQFIQDKIIEGMCEYGRHENVVGRFLGGHRIPESTQVFISGVRAKTEAEIRLDGVPREYRDNQIKRAMEMFAFETRHADFSEWKIERLG